MADTPPYPAATATVLWKRRLWKAALYGGGGVLGLLLLLTAGVHLYQDRIMAGVIAEANKSLKTRVDIGAIEVSLWRHFPHLSVQCSRVTVQGSLARTPPLARAGRLTFLFSPFDLFADSPAVGQIWLRDADVQLYADAQGAVNYDIVKSSGPGKAVRGEVRFDVRRIRLQNVAVRYTDIAAAQDHHLLAENTEARLKIRNDDYLIHLDGDWQSRFVQVGEERYFAGKRLRVSSEMQYDHATRRLMIQPSGVWVNGSAFEVMGYYAAVPHGFVDLQFAGKHTDLQTLSSLLPEPLALTYAPYRSTGEVYFKGSVLGYAGGAATPRVEVRFGCRNASFTETRSGKRITQAGLTGTYTNGSRQSRATSALTLQSVAGRLDGKPFSGHLSLDNFERPRLDFALKGTLDMAAVAAFFPQGLRNGSGRLAADIRFEGHLDDLRRQGRTRFVRTAGHIALQDAGFTLPQRPLAWRGLNGHFTFRNTDLLIRDFTGRAGRSDFRLDGRFENIFSYLLLDGQALRVVAYFRSRHLDLDELLADDGPARTGKAAGGYGLRLSPHVDMALTCRVEALRFRRFRARRITGTLAVAGGLARSPQIRLETAGGTLAFSAGVDARQPDRIQVSTDAQFDGIQVDSVFYMFEDFGQDFIRAGHLRGRVSGRLQAYQVLDRQLRPDHDQLVAQATATVRNGQLVGFAPMQSLSGFLKRGDLSNLRFGEMQNTIHIEKGTVYLPLMEITSNVADISVQGTHTFDNVMDYHLRVPLKTFLGTGTRPAHTRPPGGQTNLFVRIHGTADRYRIGYDSKAVRDKIRQDLEARKPAAAGRQALAPGPPRPVPSRPAPAAPAETEYFDFK